MNDVFARIGLALENLAKVSTMNGAERTETMRLAAELQSFDAGIGRIVAEQVEKQADRLAGDITVLKQDSRAVKDVVFSDRLDALLKAGAIDQETVEKLFTPPAEAPVEAAAETTAAPVGAETEASTLTPAQIEALDLDDSGEAGGSLPQEPTDDPLEMTNAQLREAIEAKGGKAPSNATKAELQEILAGL